jgi:hypothetical protein
MIITLSEQGTNRLVQYVRSVDHDQVMRVCYDDLPRVEQRG